MVEEKKTDYGSLDATKRNDKGDVEKPLVESDTAPAETPEEQEHHHHHSLFGIFLIMLGSFSFSVMFLLVKLMQGTADSFTLVFYRSCVQIVICLVSVIRDRENPFGSSEGTTRWWLLVRGGFGSAAVIAWFFGIQNLPLPDAVTLQFTTPPFAAAFAVCLVGETWHRQDMIGAVVCLLGVALIAHPSWLFGQHGADDESSGTAAAAEDGAALVKALAVAVTTAGAALAGIAYTSVRLIGDRASANVMVLYYGVLSIPIVIFGSRWLLGKWCVWGDGTFSAWDYFMLLLTGFAGYAGQLFTNMGLQKESAATGTLVTCTQIVWTYIFELAFLHEGINGWSLAGTVLILGFMVVVGYLKMMKTTDEEEEEIHETVAGETEEAALLFASERNEGPANLGQGCCASG